MHDLLLKIPWAKWTEKEADDAVFYSHVLTESCDGHVVGIARFLTDTVTITYLCDLFVEEACRGKSVGTTLLHRLLEFPGVRGTTVVLLTRGAGGFYRKFGFEERTAMVRRPDAQG